MDKDTYTPEEIQKKFDALPTDIKALVYSADMLNVTQTIGTKHQLHIDQIGTLEAETADVMSGFTKPEEFAANLAVSLNIDQQKAATLAQDVSDQLFVKIRESLKQLYRQGGSSAPTSPQLSVSMPSQPPKSSLPSTPAVQPVQKPLAPAPVSSAVLTPKPQMPLAPHPHDLTLVEKTVTTPATPTKTPVPVAPPAQGAAVPPPKPTDYKSDPYREPPE